MGCCLRAASKNACSLAQIRRLLEVGENEQFKGIHAERLGRLTGINVAWLTQALPCVVGVGAGARVRIYGHDFRSRAALRLRKPQICWICIRQYGYTKASWDLGLSTVCTEHQCSLIDRCPRCQLALRWDRPDIIWGHCGHAIASPPSAHSECGKLLAFQTILEESLAHRTPLAQLQAIGAFQWLDGLSPNGWMDVLTAFGVQHAPSSVPKKGTFSRQHTSDSAHSVVSRGWERFTAWMNGYVEIQDLRETISEAPLLGLLLEPSTDLDQRIGYRIYAAIFGEELSRSLRKRNSGLAQLSLFEGTM